MLLPLLPRHLLSAILLAASFRSYSQNDTLIAGAHYEIVNRFSNGKVKQVGQFATNCIGDPHCKHGTFIIYNSKGHVVKRKIYFFNRRRNKKLFGRKQGWWGFYGPNDKYFLGRKTKRIIIDPCF